MTSPGPARFQRRRFGTFLSLAAASLMVCFGPAGCRRSGSLSAVEAAVRKGELAAANQMVDEYVRQHPTEVDGLQLQARLAEAGHDYRRAAEALSALVLRSAGNIELQRRLGFALLQSAQFEQAEAVFRETLRLQPTDEAAQTELQWILFHQLRERELEAFLESCLEREPGSHRLLYHLLVSSQKPPNPHESMPVLEKIDQACPNQRTVVLGLARCAWKLGNIDKARDLFETARALGAEDSELALSLAEFELEQVNPAGVEAALAPTSAMSLEQWQTHDRWWWLQSQVAQQRGELDAALAAVSEACRRYPRSLTYQHARVTLLRLLGRGDDAVALAADVAARREADRRLYVVVHSGELDRPTPALLHEVAELCDRQQKSLQATGWRILANQRRP